MGCERFDEVVGYIFTRCDMVDRNGFSVDVILYEVVLDINTFAAFGRGPVLSYQDCSFVVNEERGGLGFWLVCVE